MLAESLKHLAVPIDDVQPLPGNPRRGDVSAVAKSLKRFGQRKPIVARRADHVVVAGNHTLQAALVLGWAEIAVVWVDDDEATAKAYALADNRTSALGTFDDADLAAMVAEVHAVDPDLLLAASFDEDDLEAFLGGGASDPAEGLTDPDAVPEPPAQPVAEVGDVWLLGPHRLVCGDSTEVDTLERLVGQDRIDLVFTDPPYGMSFGSGQRPGSPRSRVKMGVIQGDDKRGDDLVALVRDALVAAMPFRKPDSPVYVCFTWRTYAEFEEALRQADMQPKACIVWNKGSIGLGTLHYRPQHEFIFYVQGSWYGDKAQSDVWTIGRETLAKYVHSTQKPVELVQRALENSSKRGDVILDVFGGSGTTLIACHRLGRVARLVELDPKYVDVICRRYQEHTGTKPVLEATGEPHDFTVSAE